MDDDDYEEITVSNLPKGAKVKWGNSNKKVLEQDEDVDTSNGKSVTAWAPTNKTAGKAKVTATVTYKQSGKAVKKVLTCQVTVKEAPKMVLYTGKSGQDVYVGDDSVMLYVRGTRKKITWTCNHPEIAEIVSTGSSSGQSNSNEIVFQAKAAGKAKFTAKLKGGKTLTKTITIKTKGVTGEIQLSKNHTETFTSGKTYAVSGWAVAYFLNGQDRISRQDITVSYDKDMFGLEETLEKEGIVFAAKKTGTTEVTFTCEKLNWSETIRFDVTETAQGRFTWEEESADGDD